MRFLFPKNKILRFIDFHAMASKFVLDLEPTVFKLDGSSFGIRPLIYILKDAIINPSKKVPVILILCSIAILKLRVS